MNHMPMNETLKTIYARHSSRQFLDTPIDDEILRQILDAANQAPSAHNQQSWEFIAIRNAKKKELAHLVAQRADSFPKASAAILRMASRSLSSAPVVIAIKNTGGLINHGSQLFKIDQSVSADFFRTMEIQSSAAAAENLLLAATAMGLGCVWLGILYLIKDEILTFLGEEKGEFMAVIPLGYTKKAPNGPKKKPLEYLLKEVE